MSHNLPTARAQDFTLSSHRVLALQGRDAVSFAQGQFMNDVALLGDGQWQWNGWLTPKGRVIAVFALLRRDAQALWMVLGDVDPAALAPQLQRYVFRSQVSLLARDDLVVQGAFATPAVARGAEAAYGNSSVELDFSGNGGPRCLRVGVMQGAALQSDVSRWRMFDLEHGLPRLPADQAGLWTPQQLSLDRLNAYSLKKGCYPGQEIVARTHYLGKAKRSIARLQGPGLIQGVEITSSDPQDDAPVQAIGRVVCAEGDEGLAVLPLDAGNGPFRADGKPCVRLPLLGGLAR